MGLNPGDLTAYTAYENDLGMRLIQTEVAIRDMEQFEVVASSLDQIAQDLGYVTSGILAFGNDYELDDASFSGVFMAYPAVTINGIDLNIAGIDSGLIKFGLRASDGAGIFGGGNAVLDDLGVTFTGINYFERFVAENAGTERTFEMGTALESGSTLYAYMSFYDPNTGSNLQTNGDAEAGDLSGWAFTDSGAPSAANSSTDPYAGTYHFTLTTTDDADGSELQTNGNFETGDFTGWTSTGTATRQVTNTPVLIAGSYSYIVTATANQTSTLTTNLGGTPRAAVTAGLYYRIDGVYYAPSLTTYYSTFSIAIKWYTATSGGSLISTDTFPITTNSVAGHAGLTALAPPTAAGAEVVITMNRNATAGTIVAAWDTVSFKAAQYIEMLTDLGTPDRMAVTAGDTYQVSIYSKTSDADSGVWKLTQASIRWWTNTTRGSGTQVGSADVMPLYPTEGGYSNNAAAVTVPATAVAAEIYIQAVRDSQTSYDSSVTLQLDSITFQKLTLTRSVVFRPDFTIVGGPLALRELGAAADTPSNDHHSIYALSADRNVYVKDDTGRVNVVTPFQDVATPSTSASVDLQNIPQTGHDLHIEGFLLPVNDDVALFVRLNNYSGASDYGWDIRGADPISDNSDSEIQLVSGTTANAGVGNAASEGVTFHIVIPAYTDVVGSLRRGIVATSTWINASGNTLMSTAGGYLLKSEAVSRVTIFFETGNIASGKVRYYIT